MTNLVKINNKDLQVKELNNQRVVTFKDIDALHERPNGTARRNFNENKKHFIEGIDYFKICANEIRLHNIMEISNMVREDITLITESGYLMLVKSLTDDLAWKVQRELVNNYFKVKEMSANNPSLTIKEVVQMIKETRLIMKEQGSSPNEIAIVVKDICEQFNIKLPNCFVKPEETTLNDVYDMIDFIFSVPKSKSKNLTYDDYVVARTINLKLLNRGD